MQLLAAAVFAFSTLIPPPEPVTVELAGAVGPGCPEGGFTISTAPDSSSFTLRSVGDGWVHALSGKGTTYRDERKVCQMAFRIKSPEGYTYALGDTEYQGFAALQAGATGSLRAWTYFQGMGYARDRTWTIRGPYEDNWMARDHVDVAALVYHPCGAQRLLNISVEVRAAKGKSDPETVNHMYRDAYETTYGLHWKKCR